MKTSEKLRIGGLFEELQSICIAASVGNNKEPIWDGTVIGKPNQHRLVSMGLVEQSHGYYFPTRLGMAIYHAFCVLSTGDLLLLSEKLEKENDESAKSAI